MLESESHRGEGGMQFARGLTLAATLRKTSTRLTRKSYMFSFLK